MSKHQPRMGEVDLILSVRKLYEIKKHMNESPYDLFSRFLDVLMEIPKSFRPSDVMCINLFCEAYILGSSKWSENQKPHSLDQVVGWINTMEEIEHGHMPLDFSQNVGNHCRSEEDQRLRLTDQGEASESEKLTVACCYFKSNIETSACSSDEDEEIECENKEIVPNYLPWDVLSYEKTQEVHGETSQTDSTSKFLHMPTC